MKGCLQTLFSVLIFGVLIFYFFGGGLEQQAQKELDRIELQVAEDAVRQYEIASKNGSAMDAYTQAGFVAAAYLQAGDEANYKKWKDIEKEWGRKIGLTY